MSGGCADAVCACVGCVQADEASLREHLHDRRLRAQGGLGSALLASSAVFVVAVLDMLVTAGGNTLFASTLSSVSLHLVGQLVATIASVLAFMASDQLLVRRLRKQLGRDALPRPLATRSTSLRHMQPRRVVDVNSDPVHRVLSTSWDYWMWVLTSAAVFFVADAVTTGTLARHFVETQLSGGSTG